MAVKKVPRNDPDENAAAWIDVYLTGLPADQRAVLQALRETIAAAAPEATEAISYGLPAFRYHGRVLLWYHAAKAYCSLFPTAAVIDAHRAELADFGLAKGTVRFTPAHPIPAELVGEIVRDRMAQVHAAVDGTAVAIPGGRPARPATRDG